MISSNSTINAQAIGFIFTPSSSTAAAASNTESTQPTEKAEAESIQQKTQKLKQRDREVRNHEQAHLSAAGGLANGGPSFTFVTGPDGKRYAVGGEVSISVSPVAGDPLATMQKAEQIKRAALAPAQPSGQDQRVAAKAAAMQAKAQRELLKLDQEKPDDQTSDKKTVDFSI